MKIPSFLSKFVTTDRNSPSEAFDLEPPLPDTVEGFKELLQSLFDDGQARSNPWIKLGIDFGTSCSKVVWRGESDAFPVCFTENSHELESYFLPSRVVVDNGRVFAGFGAVPSQSSIVLSNFKMCLACVAEESKVCNVKSCRLYAGWTGLRLPAELDGNEVEFANAFFLATLISNARRIITRKLKKEFRRSANPKWTATLAIPETFLEKSPIEISFREVFRCAWLMANVFDGFSDGVDIDLAVRCYLAARSIALESFDSEALANDITFGCAVYPEVGAEVASIVMNRNSDPGLYAFVDIGAGTVDASFFHYFRDGKDAHRPTYASQVSKSLGAAHIEAGASQESGYPNQGAFSPEELLAIKERYNLMTDDEKAVVEIQHRFLKACAKKIGWDVGRFLTEVFRFARDKKDRSIVNQTIRLVLGGGGASLKTYQKAAEEAFTLKDKKSPVSPMVIPLIRPEDFQMAPLPSAYFHRFAVAYGLTYSVDALPPAVFPKDVEPPKPPTPRNKDFNPLYD